MADLKKTEHARTTFGILCRALDNNEWRYTKNMEKLTIECGAQGEDLPMEITIKVDADRQIVMFLSRMPFAIQEDKRLDVAVAVSAINNAIVDGCFDYDIVSGNMFFRMTNSFMDSIISGEVFSYMLFCACKTIDDYNDKFFMLSKGMMSLEQFISTLEKEQGRM